MYSSCEVLFIDLDDEKGIGPKCWQRCEHRRAALRKEIVGQERRDFGDCALKRIKCLLLLAFKFCVCIFVPASVVGALGLHMQIPKIEILAESGGFHFRFRRLLDCQDVQDSSLFVQPQ